MMSAISASLNVPANGGMAGGVDHAPRAAALNAEKHYINVFRRIVFVDDATSFERRKHTR